MAYNPSPPKPLTTSLNFDKVLGRFRYRGRIHPDITPEQARSRRLDNRTRKLLRYRCGFGYSRPHTINETADYLGIYPDHVRQLEDQALDIINGL